MVQQIKNPPATQETQKTWVQSLGQENPLEKGNGKPLQCSYLENPVDRGAWRPTVHRVAKSRTRLNKVAERPKRASQVALVVKNPPANPRDAGKLLGWGRSLGGEHGNPLQYSCLENPKGRAWWRTVHRVANRRD